MLTSEVFRDIDKLIDRLTFGASRLEPPLPGPAPPQSPTFRRILVAVDGSEGAKHATAWARAVSEVFHTRVWAVTVVSEPDALRTYGPAFAELARIEEREAEAALHDAVEALADEGIEAVPELAHGSPAKGIARAARAHDVDLIVLGSRGRGPFGRMLIGSVADAVKTEVDASVLIAKGEPPPLGVLAPTDGSRSSKRAAAVGLRLGRAWGLPATVLHVVPPPSFGPLEAGRRAFEEAFADLDLSGMQAPGLAFEIGFGDPARQILEFAGAAGSDLIVLGHRGLGGSMGLAAGGVSHRVAHESDASVLLVKEMGMREGGLA